MRQNGAYLSVKVLITHANMTRYPAKAREGEMQQGPSRRWPPLGGESAKTMNMRAPAGAFKTSSEVA